MRAPVLPLLFLAGLSASSASSPPDAALAAAKAHASRAAADFAAAAADEGAALAAWLRARESPGARAAEETHQMAGADARARLGRLAAHLRRLEAAGVAHLLSRLSSQEQAFRALDPPPTAEGLRLFYALRLSDVSADIALLAAAHAGTAERIAQAAGARDAARGSLAALPAEHGAAGARAADLVDGAAAAHRQHSAETVAAAYARSILAAAQRYRAHVERIAEALAPGPDPQGRGALQPETIAIW